MPSSLVPSPFVVLSSPLMAGVCMWRQGSVISRTSPVYTDGLTVVEAHPAECAPQSQVIQGWVVAAPVDDSGAFIAVPVGEDAVQHVEECVRAVCAALVDEGVVVVAAIIDILVGEGVVQCVWRCARYLLFLLLKAAPMLLFLLVRASCSVWRSVT